MGAALVATLLSGLALQANGDADFPAFVWRQRYRGRALPEELVTGFGGTNVEGADEARWALEQGLAFYVGHAPGRNDLHLDWDEPNWHARWKSWYDDRSDEHVYREPCLTDADTLERMRSTLARSLDARDGGFGFGYSLGDEVGLTPGSNPFDACGAPSCVERWQGLPELAGPPPTTDVVRRALARGEESELGRWLAARRAGEALMLESLTRLADQVHASSPDAPVGLLGLSRTPFGGHDLAGFSALCDFVEPYPVLDTRELFYSARAASGRHPADPVDESDVQRVLATVFLQDRAPDAAAWQVWEHWMRGGDGVVIWSDLFLEDSLPHRERLRQALADVRAIRLRFGSLSFRPRNVALVHDGDSAAHGWLMDARLDGPTWPRRFDGYHREHGSRPRAVRKWLRVLEDTGWMPGSVELGSPAASDYEVLVLVHQSVVDADERRVLEEHLEDGGVLVVDGPLGLVDPDGRVLEPELLARLKQLGPGRVLTPPRGLDRVLATRIADGVHSRFRSWVAKSLEKAGVNARAPQPRTASKHAFAFLFGGLAGPKESEVAKVPWLHSWSPLDSEEGDSLHVLLPNLVSQEERELLRDLPLEFVAPEGSAMQWIHPQPESAGGTPTLRAGDAAVFRLYPIK